MTYTSDKDTSLDVTAATRKDEMKTNDVVIG